MLHRKTSFFVTIGIFLGIITACGTHPSLAPPSERTTVRGEEVKLPRETIPSTLKEDTERNKVKDSNSAVQNMKTVPTKKDTSRDKLKEPILLPKKPITLVYRSGERQDVHYTYLQDGYAQMNQLSHGSYGLGFLYEDQIGLYFVDVHGEIPYSEENMISSINNIRDVGCRLSIPFYKKIRI
jgi:hypothetical protein